MWVLMGPMSQQSVHRTEALTLICTRIYAEAVHYTDWAVTLGRAKRKLGGWAPSQFTVPTKCVYINGKCINLLTCIITLHKFAGN